jgi:hypothetical protein
MNRTVVTSLFCPMRWIRARAWSSTVGFLSSYVSSCHGLGSLPTESPMGLHEVGSRSYSQRQSNISRPMLARFDYTGGDLFVTHPTAPQDNVNSKILIEESLRNMSTMPCLFFCGTFPSNLRQGIPACVRPAATTSSVVLHMEKTTLIQVSQWSHKLAAIWADGQLTISRHLVVSVGLPAKR